jgi:hypothetical protein
MDGIVVPSYPTPDLTSRRSSLSDTLKPVVLPLASSNMSNSGNANHQNSAPSTRHKVDPAAVSVAANAARQRPTQPENRYRRGSLDANVEYAVAMVNIVDPSLDNDDRNMCPFGTRRDSVCGNNESPRSRRRNLKKKLDQIPGVDQPPLEETICSDDQPIHRPLTKTERLYFL